MTTAELSPRTSQLSQSLARLEQDADVRRRELEAEIKREQEIQHQRANLQVNVERAADQLTHADSQFASLKDAAKQVRLSLTSGWGLSHADGSVFRAPDYSALPGIEAAIADFPRVRAVLNEQLASAEAALAAFENHNL